MDGGAGSCLDGLHPAVLQNFAHGVAPRLWIGLCGADGEEERSAERDDVELGFEIETPRLVGRGGSLRALLEEYESCRHGAGPAKRMSCQEYIAYRLGFVFAVESLDDALDALLRGFVDPSVYVERFFQAIYIINFPGLTIKIRNHI